MAAYKIFFKKSVENDFNVIPKKDLKKILERIEGLAEDPDLMELVRYIHLNPLRAELVADYRSLKGFSYAGHCALMGRCRYDWQNTEYILSLFGRKTSKARRSYSEFVDKGVATVKDLNWLEAVYFAALAVGRSSKPYGGAKTGLKKMNGYWVTAISCKRF